MSATPLLSPDPAPLLRLEGISKTFPNGTVGIGRFDLTVNEGEIVTLIGPSGCGKSTVLRMIAGLERADEGAILWRGGKRPELGFVFQEATLMPWASAFDNVWLPLRLKGVSREKARQAIEEALELVGLADFARAAPRELSGGMRMRVSIARALVLHPPLLLMDEPFAALDEITRFRLNDDLLAVRERIGCTVLFVTHSIFEAAYLSSRVVTLTPRPGRVFDELRVEPPLPRRDDFRLSPGFAEAARHLSEALQRAMTDEPA